MINIHLLQSVNLLFPLNISPAVTKRSVWFRIISVNHNYQRKQLAKWFTLSSDPNRRKNLQFCHCVSGPLWPSPPHSLTVPYLSRSYIHFIFSPRFVCTGYDGRPRETRVTERPGKVFRGLLSTSTNSQGFCYNSISSRDNLESLFSSAERIVGRPLLVSCGKEIGWEIVTKGTWLKCYTFKYSNYKKHF